MSCAPATRRISFWTEHLERPKLAHGWMGERSGRARRSRTPRGIRGGPHRIPTEEIVLAREGRPAAQAEVVEALRPRLERMARYYGRRCGEDPDDLMQEAWVALLEALREVDVRIGSPEQFLIQKARWRMLDAIKRARIRRCVTLEQEWLPDETPAPDEEAVSGAAASEFLGRLTPQQNAIVACLLEGKTWREAGGDLGCTSANIAYHVRQIRGKYCEWVNE